MTALAIARRENNRLRVFLKNIRTLAFNSFYSPHETLAKIYSQAFDALEGIDRVEQ